MKNPLIYLILFLLWGCATSEKVSQSSPPENINRYALYYYSMAEAAYNQGDLQTAADLFEKASQQDPGNIYLMERWLEILNVLSRKEPALHDKIIDIISDAFQKGFYSSDMLILLAESYRTVGNYEQAEFFLSQALEIEPSLHLYLTYFFFQKAYQAKTDTLLLYKALEYPWENRTDLVRIADSFKEFNPAMRVSVLEKAYEKWNDEIIITPLLQAYEETDQQQKIPLLIRERLDKDLSVGDHLKTYLIASYFSNRDFLSILELKNICYELNNPDLLRFLFISALNLHNIDLMIESASYLESLDEIPADFLPLLYGYLGYAYYQKGQWQEALTNFCQTEDVELLLEIFRTLVDPEDIESKIAMVDFLSRYSEDCPENDTVSFISTYIYAIIGYKEEAFGYLNMISPSFLADKELYLPLAIAYLTGLDAVDKATTILEARKEQDPSIDEVMATYYYNKEADSLAYVYFKKILHEQEKPEIRVFMVTSILADEFEDTENILPLLEKSLTIYPDNPEVMNMIGYAIADNEITAKYGLAEELLTQALALDSENGMIWDSLAWLYFRQGKISEALNAMEVPLSEEIQHSEIAYHLGEIFLMLGREKEAREYLLLAVELDNDENAVQISRQLLEMMDKK